MNTISQADCTAQHQAIDAVLASFKDVIEDTLLELDAREITPAVVFGQIMMSHLTDHPCCPSHSIDDNMKGRFSSDQKKVLLEVADYIGPDYAQAFYHAAVFMTRVA